MVCMPVRVTPLLDVNERYTRTAIGSISGEYVHARSDESEEAKGGLFTCPGGVVAVTMGLGASCILASAPSCSYSLLVQVQLRYRDIKHCVKENSGHKSQKLNVYSTTRNLG